MAYVVRTASGNVGAVTAAVIDLPSSSTNDLIVLAPQTDGGSALSTIVGNNGGTWVQQANQSGGDEIWVFTCVQGATPDTQVTVTWTSTARTTYTVAVIRGADTTTPVDVVATSNGSSKAPTAPSVTTTTDDCLIMFLVSTGTGENTFPFEGAYVPQQYKESYRSNTLMAYTYQQVLGATGTYQFYNCSPSGRNSAMVTLAIRDDGNGDVKGYHDPSAKAFEFLHMMCENGGIFSDGTTYDPSDVANENISTISNGSYTNTNTGTHNSKGVTLNALSNGYASRQAQTTTTALNGHFLMVGYPITATDGIQDNHDLSGEILIANIKLANASARSDNQIGTAFGLSDKTNARFWQLNAPDSIPSVSSGLFPTLIDVDDSSFVMDEVGVPVTTDVGSVILCSEPTSTYSPLYVAPVSIMRTMKLQGGSVNFPCSFETAYDIAKDGLLNTVLAQGGLADNQYLVAHDTQCGGTSTVYWDSSNQAVEWPAEYSAADSKRSFKIGAAKLTHTVGAIAGSTVIYDSCTLNFGNYHNFILDSAVAISSEGLSVLNATVTLKNNGSSALSGVSFSGCKEVGYTTLVDLSGGNTVSNCVDTTAITVTSEADFNKLANCTFSNNNRAITITGNQTGSWSDPNLTVSGNTYDIEYTGTTDFSIQSASALTVNNASTGTLTIVTPVQAFQIDSSETGSLIQIFTTGTQTVLDSTTGSSLNYPYTGTVVVDYVVQKAGFLPQRFTGITLTDSTTSVVLADDPVYDSSHGLTYTTDLSYNRSTKELTLSTRQEGRDFYSALIDAFIVQTSLRNTAFDFKAVGPDSIFFLDDAEIIDSSSEDNWKGAGIRYLSSSDVVTAEWVSVKSAGTIPAGATGEYQQVDGSGTTDLRATGAVDQIIQVYGDATHGNFDYRDHLVVKYQVNGYREVRADVLDLAGITALEPFEYSIAMEPVAINAATGDPAVTITVTDHGASPVSWNSKNWSITVLDSGAVTGEEIIRELNYNLSLDTTYQGKDPFNWPEMVLEAGSAYETGRGITEGGVGATLKGVRVLRGSDPHPDFTRMQADDGTYYTVPVTANGSITGIVSGSRVRIYNETTATETYNDVPGTSYAVSYTDGTTYSSGDVIKIYITQTSGTTAQLPFTTTTVASSSGWTALADQISDDVYDGFGLNGSAITKFSADYTNDEIDLIVTSNFAGDEFYAWWAYNLTTSQGIADFYGGVTAQDAANLLINNATVNIFWDNTTSTNVYQTDNIRIYRADGAYPVKNPTSGGGGIDVVWRDRVYIAETGVSGLTPTESSQLAEISSVNTKIGTPASTVSADIAVIDANVDSVLVDTGTTIPAQISGLNNFNPASDVIARVTLVDTVTANTDMRGTDGANTIAPDNAGVAAIKAKTDALTFTKANELDANIQSVNDVTVSGTGETGDEWGP